MEKNIELWIDCFSSMTDDEYFAHTNNELEDIFKDWLQKKAIEYKELLSSNNHIKQSIKDISDFTTYYSGLDSKAKAYDRMMNGSATMKEFANIIKHPIAFDSDDTLHMFFHTPQLCVDSDGDEHWRDFEKNPLKLPKWFVIYDGDYKNSLTMPDRWEENGKE